MHKDLPGITHEFGPWSPMRFIPVPFRVTDGREPAFWVATSRMCRGMHDWKCTESQTQTFGPLVLEGAGAEDVWACPNCLRQQPAADKSPVGRPEVCLYCTDMATVQHLGDGREATAALSAVAALHGATTTLRQVKEADKDGYLALLEETGDCLRSLLEDAAQAVRQDPARARQTGYATLTLIARQVLANARDYAELLPVKENEGD